MCKGCKGIATRDDYCMTCAPKRIAELEAKIERDAQRTIREHRAFDKTELRLKERIARLENERNKWRQEHGLQAEWHTKLEARIEGLEAMLCMAKELAVNPSVYCYQCSSPARDCGCDPDVWHRDWDDTFNETAN